MAKRINEMKGVKTPAIRVDHFIVGEVKADDNGETGVALVFSGLPLSVMLTPAKAKELHEALGLVLRSMVKPGIN